MANTVRQARPDTESPDFGLQWRKFDNRLKEVTLNMKYFRGKEIDLYTKDDKQNRRQIRLVAERIEHTSDLPHSVKAFLAYIFLRERLIAEPLGSTNLDFIIKVTAPYSRMKWTGNSRIIDGWESDCVKFRGRGLFGLTGRLSYEEYLPKYALATNYTIDKYLSDVDNMADFCNKRLLEMRKTERKVIPFALIHAGVNFGHAYAEGFYRSINLNGITYPKGDLLYYLDRFNIISR